MRCGQPLITDVNHEAFGMQVSTQAEEERLGIDFAAIWKENQMPQVLALTEAAQKKPESADAKELTFPSEYSQPCAS